MFRILLILISITIGGTVLANDSHAFTTTYRFSSPPDNVFVNSSPGGTTSGWPAQLINTGRSTEVNAGILFQTKRTTPSLLMIMHY